MNEPWIINLWCVFAGMAMTTSLLVMAVEALGESSAGLKLVYGVLGFGSGMLCTLIAVMVML